MNPSPPRRVVVVDNALIASLAALPPTEAVARCVGRTARGAAPAPRATGCKGCAAHAARAAQAAEAKRCLVTLPQADKDALKAQLKATTLVVMIADEQGRVVTHSF